MVKLKIISDGTPWGTKIVVAETGEEIEGVMSIQWYCTVNEMAMATVKFVLSEIDVEGLADIEMVDLSSLGEKWKMFQPVKNIKKALERE